MVDLVGFAGPFVMATAGAAVGLGVVYVQVQEPAAGSTPITPATG